MLNWEMELKRWCPGFKILTYYGSQKERKLKRQVQGLDYKVVGGFNLIALCKHAQTDKHTEGEKESLLTK